MHFFKCKCTRKCRDRDLYNLNPEFYEQAQIHKLKMVMENILLQDIFKELSEGQVDFKRFGICVYARFIFCPRLS